jgi:hypothetical protein
MTVERKNYLIEVIIKNLEELSGSLNELTNYTKDEIKIIKVEFEKLISDVKMLKERPCPRNPEALKEVIEVERLKYNARRPKEFREVFLWGVTIVSAFVAMYFAIKGGGTK